MKIESNRSKLEPKGAEVIVVGYSLISQSYLVFNPTTSRLSATVNFQPDLSMFYDKSLHHSPTTLGEIESEIPIIPDNIVQEELPAAIAPPEIKQCDLLEDFNDFVRRYGSGALGFKRY